MKKNFILQAIITVICITILVFLIIKIADKKLDITQEEPKIVPLNISNSLNVYENCANYLSNLDSSSINYSSVSDLCANPGKENPYMRRNMPSPETFQKYKLINGLNSINCDEYPNSCNLSQEERSHCNSIIRITVTSHVGQDPSFYSETIQKCKDVYFYIDSVKSPRPYPESIKYKIEVDNNIANILQTIPECDNEECYTSQALAQNDSSKCDNIWHEMGKENCHLELAKQNKDISECNLIPSESYVQGDCYLYFAKLQEDISLCEKIGFQLKKEECWAWLVDNISYCKDIEDKNLADRCYRNLAVKENDSSICSFIEFDFSRDRCYGEVAINLKDVSICDNSDSMCIKDVARVTGNKTICYEFAACCGRDDCLVGVARSTKEKEICDEVSDEKLKSDCLFYANNSVKYGW